MTNKKFRFKWEWQINGSVDRYVYLYIVHSRSNKQHKTGFRKFQSCWGRYTWRSTSRQETRQFACRRRENEQTFFALTSTARLFTTLIALRSMFDFFSLELHGRITMARNFTNYLVCIHNTKVQWELVISDQQKKQTQEIYRESQRAWEVNLVQTR